jgi:hypothetical protein
MDIVEVAPAYDWAETTAQLANRCALEAISALAAKRVAETAEVAPPAGHGRQRA